MDFLVMFPLSVLIVDPKYDSEGSLSVTRETMVVSGGPPGCMVVFTDEDLANRYARFTGASTQVVLLETHASAAEFARRMKAFHSCTTVAVDPSVTLSASRVPLMPIDEFISDCESSH